MGGRRGRLITSKDRQQAIDLIEEACKSGARQKVACELLDISYRTLSRWKKEGGLQDQRALVKRTPGNKFNPEERQKVIDTVNLPVYQDLSPEIIVVMLADKNEYIGSVSTVYKILREEKQIKRRDGTRLPRKNKPKELIAKDPNQIWSWDITYLSTEVQGIFVYLYMVMDIFSRKIVAFSVHNIQSSDYAADLMTQACIDERISPNQIILHSDNGSPMKGVTMLAKLEELGISASFSRPSVSDDNPYSESLFKTLKYNSKFPECKSFADVTEARKWSVKFVSWYNNEHKHSAIKFVTPNQRHNKKDIEILQKRHLFFEEQKQKRPDRWSGNTRNWDYITSVSLNPNRKEKSVLEDEVVE